LLRLLQHRRGGVASALAAQALLDEAGQVAVGRAGAERSAQVDLALVEQAPAEVTVGREARPVAGAAEGLGHRGDDADLPLERAAILLERVVHLRGASAAVVEPPRLEAELLLEPGADAGGGEHLQLLAP